MKKITFCQALSQMDKLLLENEKWNKAVPEYILQKYQQGFRSGFIAALNLLKVEDPPAEK
jgi:hypothetical protein